MVREVSSPGRRETFHLEAAILLDPNHEEARRALGYRRDDGEWVLADELMTARGFVRYKGRWRLPQDVESMEREEARDGRESEWKRQIRIWRRWLGTPRETEAVNNLLALSDPAVTPLIVARLNDAKTTPEKRLWIRVLSQLASPGAAASLLALSVEDPDPDVRAECLDVMEQFDPPAAVPYYCHELTSSDIHRVRRAAIGLQRVGNESAIVPLINALITEHKIQVAAGDPNRMDAIFNGDGGITGGTGFSTGRKLQVVTRQFTNREALDALIRITRANFQYDQAAWRQWYGQRDLPEGPINLRRGT